MVKDKRIYLSWTEQELSWLRANYSSASPESLRANLRGRKLLAIDKKASVIGVSNGRFAQKKANLSILLKEDPVTYYWLGFLLADGGFTDRRIQLGVAKLDLPHLERFLTFVSSSNKIQVLESDQFRVKLANVAVVKALKEKFSISSRKTYEPCDLSKITNPDLLFALVVGFLDGDGSITRNKKFKNSYRLYVVGHSSWLLNFKYMQKFLHQNFSSKKLVFREAYLREVEVKLPGKEVKTKHQVASFYISRNEILMAMKQKADNLELPYLNRKLGKVTPTQEWRKGPRHRK